jgi:uncharacterized protein YdhG (YjbR/CyaY superfamily)
MSPKKATQKPAKRSAAAKKSSNGFTAEEKAAMKERARELRAQKTREDGERDLLAKIAEMKPPDRAMAKRLHEIITDTAPGLSPRTWYGMPAYSKDDNVLCFFQPSQKFKTRYSTLGFNNSAKLDQGAMWPVAFALTELTPTEEAKIVKLVKKAVS